LGEEGKNRLARAIGTLVRKPKDGKLLMMIKSIYEVNYDAISHAKKTVFRQSKSNPGTCS